MSAVPTFEDSSFASGQHAGRDRYTGARSAEAGYSGTGYSDEDRAIDEALTLERSEQQHRRNDEAERDASLDHGAAFRSIAEACRRVADGDLESRVPLLGDPALDEVRHALNHLIDVTDAFVREAGASLVSASSGRYYRRFLEAGMPGSFKDAARKINTARRSMERAAENLGAEAARRTAVAETVLEVSTHVAAASTELSASADTLNGSAQQAVHEVDEALLTVETLERSSAEIEHAVTLIKSVAAQTNLLALNATIEAARAGEAGRGFEVVANEVKALARETASASGVIIGQVRAAQEATGRAVGAIGRISSFITDISIQMQGIADAAGASGSDDSAGLSQMAEKLREELNRLVDPV
ncbi:MAG TPA: methyl-accepting chemotaxis protein [Acidimicrobiales bacterium]|nr:methyl-accepting chemotaxis protein [Acidimicrobiales bacterium]